MSTQHDLPDGYRTAECCANCYYGDKINSWEGYLIRCQFGLKVGELPTNTRNVDVDSVCNEYKEG